jgi:5'(3')-deoxyribonucleotidase
MKNKKENLAIDLDSTLADYSKGWLGPTKIGEPLKNAKEALDILHKHFNIIIFSVRDETKEGHEAIVGWLQKHDIPYDAITSKKPAALIVDDNCVVFKGNWKQTIQDIANFKNWNEPKKDK